MSRAPGWFAALAVLAGVGLCACATSRRADFVPQAVRSGIVEWRGDGRPLAARASFETGPGNSFRLVVGGDKNPLTLTRAGGEWTATGVLAGRGWQSAGSTAPGALAGWMCVVEAFEGAAFAPEGGSDVRTGRLSVRYDKHGDKLRGFQLVVVATGDRFRVTF